jgi:hypothetical protein
VPGDEDLQAAVAALTPFLSGTPLTARIAALEHNLQRCERSDLDAILGASGVSPDLLRGAMLVRARLGRVNDLIHAAAIALALAELLEPGEVLRRPSLAAGNDPSRPYDVETDRRIAEFKLSRWAGADAGRKRQLFKDLVHLAADGSDRRAELYVLGDRPLRFLTETRSKASWGLDRFPSSRKLFEAHFGTLDVPIREFTNGPGAHVELVDLEERLPDLFAPLASV